MSALVSPRGLASPSRSARFSSAWGKTQRPAQLGSSPAPRPSGLSLPWQSDPRTSPPSPRWEAELTHLVILHLHIIHVQV